MRRKASFGFFLAAGICILYLLNGVVFSEKRGDMNTITGTLKSHGIEHYLFSDGKGSQFLVVPKFGGRILAVTIGGENLFWTHPDILSGQGGQRSWVSPEGGPKGFLFQPDWKGTRDFSMMDPGNYRVVGHKENEYLALENTFQTVSNDGKENYNLILTREMQFEEDPFKEEPEAKNLTYHYLGIDFVHRLKNNSPAGLDRILALWCLIQVPPKGTMIVPVHQVTREAWRGNYFEPIPEEFAKSNPDSISFFLHGSQRYKVGIRPESSQGAIAYLVKAETGDASLVVMTFPVKPEGRYVDKPRAEQEMNGDAIQIYSHLEEGRLAFGEMECHSWGLELPPGGEAAFPAKIYAYKASLEVIQKIGKRLVCPQFDKAYLY